MKTITRADDNHYRKTVYHDDYMRRREERLAYAHDYYIAHKERIAEQQRQRRRRYKIEGKRAAPYQSPSIQSIEYNMPVSLYTQRFKLRSQFLAIPINKRPTYDYFLRCEVVKFYRTRNYERREQ